MRRNYKRDTALHSLANEFESMSKRGSQAYFEDRHLFKLIDFYENEFSFEKAMEVTDFALEQFKYRIDFYIIKVRLFIKIGELNSALALLEQAENISPMEWELKLMKCRIYSRMKDHSNALSLIAELKEKNTSRQDYIDLLMEEAFVYEKMKDFSQMYYVLEEVLTIYPKHAEALEHIWMCVEICKNYSDSIALHEKIINKNPYIFQAWYNLGHAYSCQGEYEKSIQALEYSFIINPAFEFGYKDCAELCFQVKNYEKALDVFLEYNERFGPEAEVLISLGQCYLALDNAREAKKVLRKSSKLDPYSDEVFYFMGLCEMSENNPRRAVQYFLNALHIEDRREEYFASIAKAYSQLEEYDKADYYYRKATETGPEQADYWNEHASFFIQLGKYNAAMDILDEAEYYSCSPDLLYSRAACLILTGRKEEGLAVLYDALTDDFNARKRLFELCPQLISDEDIKAIIEYIGQS